MQLPLQFPLSVETVVAKSEVVVVNVDVQQLGDEVRIKSENKVGFVVHFRVY